MKKQKINENHTKLKIVDDEYANLRSDDIKIEEFENEHNTIEIKNELTPSEIYEKQQEAKEIEQKMKELEKKKEKIENELDKENKLKDIYDFFKNERDQFVFKVEYKDQNFYENSAKGYITAILKGIGKSQNKEIKVLKVKILSNYLWFKLNEKIFVKWFVKKIEQKNDFVGFTITQFRAPYFFEDI